MHAMREQLMVRISAVFIYLNGVSLFVKDCRQVTYGAFTFITYFFLYQIKKEEIIRSKYTMSIFSSLRR